MCRHVYTPVDRPVDIYVYRHVYIHEHRKACVQTCQVSAKLMMRKSTFEFADVDRLNVPEMMTEMRGGGGAGGGQG